MPFFRQPEPLVSAEFQDAPLRAALEAVFDSAQAQYNIYPEVTGIVSLGRTTLPLRKLLTLVVAQAIGASQFEEKNNVFHVRSEIASPGNLASLQKQINNAGNDARKKLTGLPPGTVLFRMPGYVMLNGKIQSLLEIGVPPQSEVVTISRLQQKVKASSSAFELTVVRLTDREIVLRSDDGNSTRVPLAGFRFYQP